MTKKQFESMGFKDAMEQLYQESNCITTYEILIEYIKHCLDKEWLNLAQHILNGMYNSYGCSDWYYYDYSAGTACPVICINTINDLNGLGLLEN